MASTLLGFEDRSPGSMRKPFRLIPFLAVVLLAGGIPPGRAQSDKKKPVDLSKEKTLYVVGYAHLDTEWRWTYVKTIRDFIPSTIHDNIALIRKYPEYLFNFTGSRRYEMMKEYYPEDYELVKKAVAEGRWFPAGSSVDEGDSVVPGTESLIRHVLYGNRFFEREFGKSSREFMLPDCFGFPWALPSILRHCGLDGFSTQKLSWGSAVGIPFKVGRWIGPDGAEVVAALDPGAYTGRVEENLARSEKWENRIKETGDATGVYVDYHYYGTGDKGGAPGEDSVEWISKSVKTDGPVRVISSEADAMFKTLTPEQIAKLPSYDGEFLLTEHSAGSITSQAMMKRWNKKNELLADAAERASVAAMWLGGVKYPSKVFYDAWNLILGSQMHDILPGTSLPKAYEYAWNDEILAANLLAETEINAVAGVAAAMDTTATGTPLIVYNPLSIEREDPVEATVYFPDGAPARVVVHDPAGNAVPTQVLDRTETSLKILFLAKVPSVGFAVFDVRPSETGYVAESPLRVTNSEVENARYRVRLNGAGDVASIFDKVANRELLSAPVQLQFLHERPQEYPAWNMDWSDRQKPPIGVVDGPAKVRIAEAGPVRVALEVEREARGSKFVQQIRLTAGDSGNRIEMPLDVDWMTKGVSFKAAFPLTVSNPMASYDSQLGIVKRGNNEPKKYEVPQHEWFDLSTDDYGVAVLTEAKYGSDKPADDTLRLTLLYTPAVRGVYQDQESQDIGRHRILYALAGHPGPVEQSDVAWQAARMNQPLVPFITRPHEGALGKTFSLFQVDNPQVAIIAIKKAEDSDAIVVRFRELTGSPAKVTLRAATAIEKVAELNGQEHLVAEMKPADGAVEFEIGRFGLKTLAVQLASPPVKVEPPVSTPVKLPFNLDVASTDRNRSDGKFDGEGRTYPAEMIPAEIEREGVKFVMGSTKNGANNAVACEGQTIELPADAGDRLHLLAAASDGAASGVFKVGNSEQTVHVQDWSGYVGLWDNRLWGGDVPEEAFEWSNPRTGLVPGYVRRDPVAWFASHRHHPKDGNAFYQYSYLFKYVLAVPKDATTVTLPDNPRIRIAAMTLVKDGFPKVTPARPLYDTLESHQTGGRTPGIVAPDGVSNDVVEVTIHPPLYHEGPVRYTTDGSDPTLESPEVTGPIRIASTTTVKARAFLSSKPGPVASRTVRVEDSTPPTVVSADAMVDSPQIRLKFSEQIDPESAQSPENFAIRDRKVKAVKADDCSVLITLDKPLEQDMQIGVRGIRDTSPARNAMEAQGVDVVVKGPVFRQKDGIERATNRMEVDGLPTASRDAWTLNLFVRPVQQPENRTLIAGFGSTEDKQGQGRYFAKFGSGIHFWTANADVRTSTPLDVGKWQMLTAAYDGKTMRLYKNAELIAETDVALADDDRVVELLPVDPWDRERKLKGEVSGMTVWNDALPPEIIEQLWQSREVGR